MNEHAFLEHLRKDHSRQKHLGKKLCAAIDIGDRKKLRQSYYDCLLIHIVGEEASIFPLLTRSDDQEARDHGLEAIQEHHVLKIVLYELMELSAESDIFKAKAKILDELNQRHIEEEETTIFAYLYRLCDNKNLDGLFKKFADGEERARLRK